MTFEPELGQMLFGQPHQEFAVPDIWEAALSFLGDEMKRVMWNIHKKSYSTPFNNSGELFDCPTFSAHAYSWGDDDQPWNFKWRDVEISWYKYLGRGMSANKELTAELAAEMLAECLEAMREHEKANCDFGGFA